jgi:hypothetical protein
MTPMPSALPPVDPGMDPLAGLRGYRLPDPVAWWPPAPGWWVLAALLVAVAAVLVWWWLRRRRCMAAVREARRELVRLRREPGDGLDTAAQVRRLSTLLRRYALAQFPRREVAALTGEAWLDFLDAHGGEGRFGDGPGRQLLEAPYRRSIDQPLGPLIELVEDWILRNRGACR